MCAGTLTLLRSWQGETTERAVPIERKGGGGSRVIREVPRVSGPAQRQYSALELGCTNGRHTTFCAESDKLCPLGAVATVLYENSTKYIFPPFCGY
eukprot:COSAG01_NODE_3693_length_5788_cov_7.398137_4_plen_96_part_00